MVKTRSLLKISYWLVGSVVALLVLASLAVGFIDWNQYRGTLSVMTSERLGMRVDLAGRVSVSLLPRPEVSAETVRLLPLGDASGEAVATADRIDMRLGLSALLKGEVAFQRLGFDGIDIVFEEDASGDWRVRGWPDVPKGAETAPTTDILMERLQIVGGTVHFVEQSGEEHLIEGLSFDLQGRLPDGPLEWQGSFIATGQTVQTNGRMRPSRDERVKSLKADIGLPGGTLEISGRLLSDGFAGRVQSKGENLAAFSGALHSVLSNSEQAPKVPEQAFDFDVQIDREGTIYRAVSRQMEVGGTHGRLDLTIAPRSGNVHTTGTVSVGIIDIAPWLTALQLDTEASTEETLQPTEGATEQARLSGALDMTVEGINIGNGVVQQLDAVVRFTKAGPRVDRLQALLPGGSGLSFSGQLSQHEGRGTVQLVSGNLPELLRWAGVDVSDQIPAGRLATGELSAKLAVKEAAWQLADVTGRIDTTKLKGTLSGHTSAVWPRQISLVADVVNLDAYLSDAGAGDQTTSAFEGFPVQPMQFSLQADKLQWHGALYTAVSMVGNLAQQEAAIDHLTAQHNGGEVSLAGTIRPVADDLELQLEAIVKSWKLPVLAESMPGGREHIRALGLRMVDGKASLNGPLADVHLSVEMTEGARRRLTASGSAALRDELSRFGLQGTVKHENLAGLAKMYGMEPAGALPADITFSLERAGRDVTQIDLSGNLAGGQFLAEGTAGAESQNWRITYDHRNAAAVVTLLGNEVTLPEPTSAIRATATVTKGATDWGLDNIDMRNGQARLAGNLEGEKSGRIGGSLAIAGISFNPSITEGGGPSSAETRIDQSWFDHAGQVNLAFEQVKIAGQQITAPKAILTIGDGVARLDLGEGAQVNGTVATLSVDLAGGQTPKLSGKTKLDNLDIGSMLSAYGLPSALVGSASLDFAFEGEGQSVQDLIGALKGRGEFKGRAGNLNFLSVPSLVREMGRAPSASSFLASIGGWLRQGSTSYSNLEASLTLDSGNVLLERFNAGGDWGGLTLDGQISFVDSFMNLKGQLDLASPPDAPVIPVQYSGPIDNPTSNWASRALERFVIAGIERRIRTGLLKDLDKIQGDKQPINPGAEVFSRAFGFLDVLRKKQEAEKQKAKEQEGEDASEDPSQGTEEQRP